MASTIISGCGGAIDGMSTIGKWAIKPTVQVASAIASNTKCAPIEKAGNADWTATVEWFGKVPPAYPGDAITFLGYTGTDSYTGAAIVMSVTHNAPIEDGGFLGGTLEIGGNGALAQTATTETDSSSPQMHIATAAKVTWAGSDMEGVKSWTVTLARDIKTYVQAGIVKRKAAGYRCSGSIQMNEGTIASIVTPGTIDALRLYVNATEYWGITYAMLRDPNLDVDINGGALVGGAYQFGFTGWKDVAGTPTKGSIVKPGGGDWWT